MDALLQDIHRLLREHNPLDAWRLVVTDLLKPSHPFEVHRLAWDTVFRSWDEQREGPCPAWIPSPEQTRQSNIGRLMARLGVENVPALQRWAASDRAEYWNVVLGALGVGFRERPTTILDARDGAHARWLLGAKLNIIESCFREGDDEETAIIYGMPGARLLRWTYGDLRRLSNRVSNGLRAAGFAPGDAVAIVTPMTPESVAIYLGIVQAGCAVVGIADSFAPPEIATRLKMAGAKGVFTVAAYTRGAKRIALYDKVIAAGAARTVVLGEDANITLRDGDVRWEDFLGADEPFAPHVAAPGETINILFSSGTTGEPKAIPWDHSTPIKCAADAHFHQDVRAGDVLAWPTSLGWMMGPWLIFAALMNRATIALFGDAPAGRAFGEFVAGARVTMLGVVPTIIRAWRESGCMEGLDWSAIRAFSSTGEASDPHDMFYLMRLAGYRPVIEYCGGTEIGGGYITSTVAEPNSPSAFSTPALGLDVAILDDAGKPADNGEMFIVPPSIGLSNRLLNRDHDAIYSAGTPRGPKGEPLRRHGDCFERLPNGYYRALGRADDTMNLGGIKVGCAEIERVLNRVPGVKETAAVATSGSGPSKLVVFAVTTADAPPAAELRVAMQRALSQELNPLFKVHDVRVVESLPRTASNKVMRRELRAGYS